MTEGKKRPAAWGRIAFLGVFLSLCLMIQPRETADKGFFEAVFGSVRSFGTWGMLLPVLTGLLLYAGERARNGSRTTAGLWVLSGVFGILNAAGQWMYAADRLPGTAVQHIAFWLQVIACALVFREAAGILEHLTGKMLQGGGEAGRIRQGKRLSDRAFLLLAAGIILAGWLPWIITYYPMSADYDVYKPITQYLGLTAEKTDDFPWFYSTTVGFFYRLGEKLGHRNIGMFLYIVLRALAMAAIYGWTAMRLRKRGLKSAIVWTAVLFWAVTPVWGAYAKHGFKDTQSAAFFCWYVLACIDMAGQIRERKKEILPCVSYAGATLAISLYRGNCIYIALPVTVLLLAAVIAKGARPGRLRTCALLSAGVVLFFGYQFYTRQAEHVKPGKMNSAMTILFQQTARTVRDHGEELTEEDREAIGSVLNAETIGERYDPLISDPVKDTTHDLEKNFRTYLGNWFSLGWRYPGTYLEALVGQTYGYYAFNGDQKLHAGNWNCGMTIFNWVRDPRYTDDFTCSYEDSMGPARDALDRWAQIWHELPGLGLTDMKALYTWGIAIAAWILGRRKKTPELIPVFAMLLTVAFCCGSPVNDCFRYFAPVAAAFPALLLMMPKPDPEDIPPEDYPCGGG